MPVPVVIEARFELVPLPWKACIERLCAGDAVRCAPWGPDRGPHGSLGAVRHPHKGMRMVDVLVGRHG